MYGHKGWSPNKGQYPLQKIFFQHNLVVLWEKFHFERFHEAQYTLVEKDKTGEQSKEYGINRNSAINELTYFNVCDGSLIPDVMHDILEGALQYEVKLMLQVMITENYFTLSQFNSRLENIDYGYMEIRISLQQFLHKLWTLMETLSGKMVRSKVITIETA